MRPSITYNLRFLSHIIKKKAWLHSITLTCYLNIFPLKQVFLYLAFALSGVMQN